MSFESEGLGDNTDFGKITPCGGDCSGCAHFLRGECEGCLNNNGDCVHMWENGCEIFRCCREHNALFCGVFGEFPCGWIESKLGEWDKDGIEKMRALAEEYERRSSAFSENLPKLWEQIGTHGVMVLSTCADNRVTSRPMSVVVIDGKFYCQTDENYLKFRQISENPNVSLSVSNLSIEGECRIIGRPYENEFFIKAMKESFANAVERWSGLSSERVLEINPTLIYSWIYENDKPYAEYYDFRNSTYRKDAK